MLIVYAADVHLDAPLRGLRVHGETDERQEEVLLEIRRASRRAFSHLVDLCERKEVDLLLLAGDLFDTAFADFNAVRFVHTELARLAGITQVVIVKGNHDAQHVVERNLDEAAAPSRRQTVPPVSPVVDAPTVSMPPSVSGADASPAAGSGPVWVNTKSGAYWRPGTRYYGKTKKGKYLSEAAPLKAGYHAAGGQ